MNVNVHPKRIEARTTDNYSCLYLAEHGPGTAYVFFDNLAELDKLEAAVADLRAQMIDSINERLHQAGQRALESCPDSFNVARRDRLVSIAEDAAKAGDIDVDDAIHEGIVMLSAPPVCVGQAPGAAR